MSNRQAKIDNFWAEYITVGKEVLEAGKAIGYGMSLIEVKFQDGLPSVIIRSVTQNEKPETNEVALERLASELANSIATKFDGSRTFTVAMTNGKVTRILLDEYANRRLV